MTPLTRPLLRAALVAACLAGPAAPALAQSEAPQVTQADAEKVARSLAGFCKTLVGRIEGVINDKWAIEDLRSLAEVWDSLGCNQVFGIDERVRWLSR